MSAASPIPGSSSGDFDQPAGSRASLQPPSRRGSAHIDGGKGPQASDLSPSASWETADLSGSARTASPGFPYTPSYHGSMTPYGSDAGPWIQDASDVFPEDGPELEYNPADFDGPNQGSNLASPYLLDADLTQSVRSRLPADFLSTDMSGVFDQKAPFTIPGLPQYDTTNAFSPRTDLNVPSPGSSAADNERYARSRASSVSSNRFPSPAVTIGPVGEAFDKLAFDAVDSDLMWRNQQQQHMNQQPQVAKAHSPPQLLIPSDAPSSSLQIPTFGHIEGAPSNNGGSLGLAAPSINLLPATPVSGGAGAASVAFQQVLKDLNDQRIQGTPDGISGLSSHAPNPHQPASRPTTPTIQQQQQHQHSPAPNNLEFGSYTANTAFTFPAASTSNTNLGQGINNFLSFSQPSRPRALSETSLRPSMTTVDSHQMISSMAPAHPSLGGSPFSPSLGNFTPPVSSISRTMTTHRSNSFGSVEGTGLHFQPPQPPQPDHDFQMSFDSPFGVDIRRGRLDAPRHKLSRSEDFGRSPSPFAPGPANLLAPGAPFGQQGTYGYTSAVRTQDSLGANLPSSAGPARHGRRLSSSPHHERSASGSSARPSPYPSPSGSPAMMAQPLPGQQGNGGDNPWSKVERQQVTTPATAKASEGRRKGEASFVCPVPGCGSTFTRHFNLKGHLRSHNEERPFKCKWPGCEKGFARQHDCKRHEALHLNLRPYTCDGCKKTFARMDALNRHLKSEGGVDCARNQPMDDAFGLGVSKIEDAHSAWPAIGMRTTGALTM